MAYVCQWGRVPARTKDTGYEAVGLDLVRHAAARAASAGDIPVEAIGRITLASASSVLAAGATSVAVILPTWCRPVIRPRGSRRSWPVWASIRPGSTRMVPIRLHPLVL